MKIKQTLKKIKKIINDVKQKPVFSFFNFYYNVIKGDSKRFKIANTFPNNFFIILTPIILMIAQVIIGAIIGSTILMLCVLLWIPIAIGNTVFLNIVETKAREIRRKEEDLIREEERRERQERIDRMKMEHDEMIRKAYMRQEEERKRRERAEKINKEKIEKMYKDFFENGGYDGNFDKNQQNQHKTVDQNMINAMKLMSLKDGFTKQDLKSAYRRLSKIHHPDSPKGSEVNFKRLTTAYEYVLERI